MGPWPCMTPSTPRWRLCWGDLRLRPHRRRRRWYDDGVGTLAVLIASASDVDDLIPTMVALQIEWNKLGTALRGSGLQRLDHPTPADCAAACGGAEDDWLMLHEFWGVG